MRTETRGRPRVREGAGARALRARAVGDWRALRVNVLRGVLGPRIRLALSLGDRALDLVCERRADSLELGFARTCGEEILARALQRVAGAPLLDLLVRSVAAVVVVRGVRLVAVALELDEARSATATRPIRREPGLLVAVEDVHAVRDGAGHRVRRRLLRDVLDGGLLLETSRDREEVVLDDEDHGKLVHRREVRRLVEVSRARRAVAAEGENDLPLLPQLERERQAHGVR